MSVCFCQTHKIAPRGPSALPSTLPSWSYIVLVPKGLGWSGTLSGCLFLPTPHGLLLLK